MRSSHALPCLSLDLPSSCLPAGLNLSRRVRRRFADSSVVTPSAAISRPHQCTHSLHSSRCGVHRFSSTGRCLTRMGVRAPGVLDQ